MSPLKIWLAIGGVMVMSMLMVMVEVEAHDYADGLNKCILFFEGQRSGKLPSNQRVTWRKNSALRDGSAIGVDLVGGYYDAGDNVKFNFPMAFTTTMLAWSVIEFGKMMGPEEQHALEAIRWGSDYLLKATSVPGIVFAQIGEPNRDHQCWERPEDMDTPRTAYAVSRDFPGSEVSAEIAAALAASSLAFRSTDPSYSKILLKRARQVFALADSNHGSYNVSLGQYVCPFYCDFGGYQDELIWAASWLYRSTNYKASTYWNYLINNINTLQKEIVKHIDGEIHTMASFGEFGWDSKHAGISVLVSQLSTRRGFYSDLVDSFVANADKFVCTVMPESPTKTVEYSPGGLLFKKGASNMQHVTALSFLLLAYSKTLHQAKREVNCGSTVITADRLVQLVKSQVDYLLGSNPLGMSYMVGYGQKFPQRVHHRASNLPSIDQHPQFIDCNTGRGYGDSWNPNFNVLTGAVVGGPNKDDSYADSRQDFSQSEPTTYINAPLVGVLGYFRSNPS